MDNGLSTAISEGICSGFGLHRDVGVDLRPFWSYYGSKWQVALTYPEPLHRTIIEPFAGSAGYALRYPDRQVILLEKYEPVAAMWRYLIAATPSEIRRIPLCESTDDLPSWVPQEAVWLIGFWLNEANPYPCRNLSAGLRRKGRGGWTEKSRERIASQVAAIKHWKLIEGDYWLAPNIEATWFVDPPYAVKGGSYPRGSRDIDYRHLGRWCRTRLGQTMVCENLGATWLPFRRHLQLRQTINGFSSTEAIWTQARAA